jgi:hypothetical protein
MAAPMSLTPCAHTHFRYFSKERDGTYVLNAEDIINIYDIVGSFRIGR